MRRDGASSVGGASAGAEECSVAREVSRFEREKGRTDCGWNHARPAETPAGEAASAQDRAEHNKDLVELRALRAWDIEEAHRARLADLAAADARHGNCSSTFVRK